MNYQHKELANGKWFEFSLIDQLSNIGTEIGRAINWRKKDNKEYSQKSFFRGLELLSLTIDDPKNRNHRLKEFCRLYEMLGDYFIGDNQYKSTDELWEKYFYQFNYAARKTR
ncbi:MAG: hypothetical protein ABIA91_03545 [Patescibacteria group bacterium]